VLGKAVVPKTWEGWGAGLLCFNQYCDSIGLLEEGRMPTSELLPALFIANCATGSMSSSIVDKWIVGIHWGHQIADVPWGLVPSCSRKQKRVLESSHWQYHS